MNNKCIFETDDLNKMNLVVNKNKKVLLQCLIQKFLD